MSRYQPIERPHTDLTLGEITDRATALGPRLTAAAREQFSAGTTDDYDRAEAERVIVEALADEDVYVIRGCMQLAGLLPLSFNHGLLCQLLADEVLDRLHYVVVQAKQDQLAHEMWCNIQAAVARLATATPGERSRQINRLSEAAAALRGAVEQIAKPDPFPFPEPL